MVKTLKNYHNFDKLNEATSRLNKNDKERYDNYLTLLKTWVLWNLTRLDLMAVKWINKEELLEILYKEAWMKIWEQKEDKLLNKINTVYTKTIKIMWHDFRLKIPKDYSQKKWKNVDEFLDFIYSTSNLEKTWYQRLIDCAILKTMSSYTEILDNPRISELNWKLELVVKKIRKIRWISIIKEWNWDIEFTYNSLDWKEPSFTKWRITYKTKENIKILLKLIYNRGYSKVDFFKDLLQFRVEVSSKEDWENALLLFNREIFWEGALLDNKWFLSRDFMRNCWIEKKKKKEEKSWTSDDFINASLSGHFKNKDNIKDTTPAEVQFVYVWNNNESGYNKHEIYDTKKMLSVFSRLFWYLTFEDIKLLIHEFWLKSELKERWILYHLLTPQNKQKPSFLMKATACGNNCNCFISRDVCTPEYREFYTGNDIEYVDLYDADFEEIRKKYLSTKI